MHNEALIASFVKRSKRDRYREILSNPRLRHKFTDQLAHFADFDPKYRLPIPSNKLSADNIARELQRRHSPNPIYRRFFYNSAMRLPNHTCESTTLAPVLRRK